MKRLLDYDPVNKVSCYFEYTGDQVVLTHEQDVDKILDKNKEQSNDDDKTQRGMKKDWWKYATIPAIVQVEWMQKYGVYLSNPEHKSRVFKLLNSRDYSYLKTTHKIHTVKE